jgi:beta-galactosidase
MTSSATTQPLQPQSIDLTSTPPAVIRDHLNLGGSNPQGVELAVNSFYMTRAGRPYIPVMGEFHFSRYSAAFWEEELLKMKAGGIDVVATYVFWIHIEEEEGVFDWSGNKNLRHFVELCCRHGLQVIVRMGPFAHGECRNGGLPDWLYGRLFPLRSNDERYLAYVRRLYGAIAGQLQGHLYKDGGCVIGIQLENEYMHCGAPWEVTFRPGTEWVPAGSDGAAHILRLKQIALDFGLDVPLYTCTGWLRSPIPDGEILPMQGGYAFTPWSPDPNYVQAPTREFLFRNRHLDPILNGAPTYDAARYPFACCEIGGGIQDTYYHRNQVPPEAAEALAVVNLAGGANLIGYYMYHGGSNPAGRHGYLNEFTVPRISYDFQAPLREYGQAADSYRSLRLLHLFLRDFGDTLAPLPVTVPDSAAAITPEDTETPRYGARSDGNAGFLFLNNYQDHVEMQDISGIRFVVKTSGGTITIPETCTLRLEKNVSAILPFGLSLRGAQLQYATAQLLARIDDDEVVNYFFFAPSGMDAEYAFRPDSMGTLAGGRSDTGSGLTIISVTPGLESAFSITNHQGEQIRVFTLSREQAEQTCKLSIAGRERLVIADATVSADDRHLFVSSTHHQVEMLIFPALDRAIAVEQGMSQQQPEGEFTRCTLSAPARPLHLDIEQPDDLQAVVRLSQDALTGVNDVLLCIRYSGDMGSCYLDGKLVADNFNNGTEWQIGLKHLLRRGETAELYILITPFRKQDGIASYIPTGMAFRLDESELVGAIESITANQEHRFVVTCS